MIKNILRKKSNGQRGFLLALSSGSEEAGWGFPRLSLFPFLDAGDPKAVMQRQQEREGGKERERGGQGGVKFLDAV